MEYLFAFMITEWISLTIQWKRLQLRVWKLEHRMHAAEKEYLKSKRGE